VKIYYVNVVTEGVPPQSFFNQSIGLLVIEQSPSQTWNIILIDHPAYDDGCSAAPAPHLLAPGEQLRMEILWILVMFSCWTEVFMPTFPLERLFQLKLALTLQEGTLLRPSFLHLRISDEPF
jgi:hypothetical protein